MIETVKHRVEVACGNTAVRLISSGRYDNSVTLAFDLLFDIDSPTLLCPAMLEALTCKSLFFLIDNCPRLK